MPAVTVPDFTVLPRVAGPGLDARPREVVQVSTAPRGFEGEGFPVRRAFAGVDLARLDPFIHMDQMGEVEYAPGEPKGTPWHPHRGFETVTYIMDGTFEHQDSNGSGGLFHGIQLWVNLPKAEKWAAPRYQDLRAGEVRLLASDDGGALVRVIAG